MIRVLVRERGSSWEMEISMETEPPAKGGRSGYERLEL